MTMTKRGEFTTRGRRGIFTIRRQGTLGILVACALLSTSPLLASESLGWFKARSLEKKAERAFESGDAALAGELYGQLIEGLERTQKRRGRALYGASLAALETEAELSTVAGYLDELLAAMPQHRRAADAKALRKLAAATMAVPAPAPVEPPPAAEQPKVEKPEASPEAEQVKKLQRRVSSLERQLRETREEVEKKEEAIEKLKELVVGENG